MKPPHHADALVQTLVRLALDEDGADVTSQAIVSKTARAKATLLAKANGILCGIAMVEAVCLAVDPKLELEFLKGEGDHLKVGDSIAHLCGSTLSLLRAERPLLNFLQHLSGIATLTSHYVDAVAGTKMKILDTRKTLPAWRTLQKYAVRVGGGINHRYRLDEMFLIKDNHIAAAGSITKAVEKVRASKAKLPIEVEVRNLAELQEAVKLKVDRIMLDNFTVNNVQAAVKIAAGKVPLEVSGGLHLESIKMFAQAGVDYASVGRLTHSAPALDISLELVS